jgi:hypothetical protein
MRSETAFIPADRYLFDFKICTPAKGWAQFDTAQDASYFGTWVNPTTFEIVTYAEGDVRRVWCDGPEEFAAEVRRMSEWHREHDGKPGMIDPLLKPEIDAALRACGLGDLVH